METILSAASRQTAFRISEPTEIAVARRGGSELAKRLDFNETAAGEVAIIITEAASNIVKHAGHGEILIRPMESNDAYGIEIIALDGGPGMANLASSMQDGISTAGSYGVGLGAMQRLSDEFDIYTAPAKGTVVRMALWTQQPPRHESSMQTGMICLPIAGEIICGDAWAICSAPTVANVLLADGLGHGPDAAKASEAAAIVVERYPDFPPGTLLMEAHAALRATRGAAVAVARVDTLSEELQFAGVGNIAAIVFDGEDRRQMVSHNGIVGSNIRKIQEFAAPWNADSMLIMHSDGLATRWDLGQYPGLRWRHPSLIAAVLYRDFSRERDDVTVLVVRDARGQGHRP